MSVRVQDDFSKAKPWTVYLIETHEGMIYTGITKDLDRRLKEHASGKRGAKFFKRSKPKQVLVKFSGLDKSMALKLEYAIKALNRAEKLRLVKFYE